MILIDVTFSDGTVISVNAELIVFLQPESLGTIINFDRDGFFVKESPEEVKALIAAAMNPDEACIDPEVIAEANSSCGRLKPAVRSKNVIREGAILTRCYKCNRLVEIGEDCICEESEAT